MSEPVAAPDLAAFVVSVQGVSSVDAADFVVDGVAPGVAIEPEDAAQVRQILAEAEHHGLAVVPVGGRQHLGAGNRPRRYDVALSLAAMHAVVAHEPADMTVTVEPGVRLADLNAMLGRHGQTLPLDPPCGAEATVGGVLAANASGPLGHAFGTARDWLIGASLAHASGSASKSGGRVVKNVTGYDMHKLYVGSLGTLGVITQATFKLAPLAAASCTLLARFGSARDACAAALSADDAGLALHAAEVLSPAAAASVAGIDAWLVAMRVAGGHAGVERTLRDLPRHAGAPLDRSGAELWDAWSRAFRPVGVSLRATLLPTAVAPAMVALVDALADARPSLSATVSRGVVRVQLAAPGAGAAEVARARDVVAPLGTTLVLESAPPEVKDAVDVFGPPRGDAAIMRRLKQQFDPRGTLSPGRFAGRL